MPKTPALVGTTGPFPMPLTTPTPAVGEDVTSASIQAAVQPLLNQDATLQAYISDGAKTITPGRVNETYATSPVAHAFSPVVVLDMSAGLHHQIDPLTANAAISFSNFPTGRLAWIRVVQDGMGGRTITWVGGIFFGSLSSQPTPTSSVSTYYLFTMTGDGIIVCLSRN